jgi:iodothyronine deiodinase-like protein
VAFYFVYIEEAHANDVWPVLSNQKAEIAYQTHKDFGERVQVANVCIKALKIDFPTLVDDMGNTVGRAYTAWPDRLYVIDREGTIQYKSRPGPFGFEAEGVATTLARIVPTAPAR